MKANELLAALRTATRSGDWYLVMEILAELRGFPDATDTAAEYLSGLFPDVVVARCKVRNLHSHFLCVAQPRYSPLREAFIWRPLYIDFRASSGFTETSLQKITGFPWCPHLLRGDGATRLLPLQWSSGDGRTLSAENMENSHLRSVHRFLHLRLTEKSLSAYDREGIQWDIYLVTLEMHRRGMDLQALNPKLAVRLDHAVKENGLVAFTMGSEPE